MKMHFSSTCRNVAIYSFVFGIMVAQRAHSDTSIIFLHTNDMHSRIEEINQYGSKCQSSDLLGNRCYGGFGRLASKIKAIRKVSKNVILLDGGDQQTGTLWYDVFKGNATAHFVNKLNYDAMVLGNHDFDGGVSHTIQYLEKMNATFVMSNIDTNNEPSWPTRKLFQQELVRNVGGQKIGFCGYVLKSTPRVSNPGPNIKFNDEVSAVKGCAEKLKSAGVNIIVALGHSGIKMDQQIAKEVNDVDIVVGGHTNTFLYSGSPPSNDKPYGPYPLIVTKKSGKKCLVVQAFAYTKYLGFLNVTFSSSGDVKRWDGNPILLDHTVKPDADILADIVKMRGPLDKVAKAKIGQSLVFLDGERLSCRLGECALGNLMADAAVFHYASKSKLVSVWTTTAIALWTANSIMASIDANKTGYIYYEDIKNSFPYNNNVDIVELKGTVLLQVLEKFASFYDEGNPSGSFLQISGLQVTIDLSKALNKRVTDVQVRCADCRTPSYSKLVKNNVYKVIVSSYLASGGAGYEILRTKRLSHTPGDIKDIDALINYIKAKTPIFIETGNRIHVKRSAVSGSKSLKNNANLFPIYVILTISMLHVFN